MKLKRSSAVLGLVIAGLWAQPHVLRADVTTSISTLDQANRLSVLHDYSLDAVGLSSPSGVGSSGLPGTPGAPITLIPGDPGSGSLTTLLGKWASTDSVASQRSFTFSFTPLAGYDSNPEARKVALGGAFGGGDLNAVYRINIGPTDAVVGNPTQIMFSYDTVGAFYDGNVEQADTWQQTLSAGFRQRYLNDSLVISGLIQDQFTMEHGSAALDTFDVVPSIEGLFLPQAGIEASYDYTYFSYYMHAVPRVNPDATRQTFTAKLNLYTLAQRRGPVEEAPDTLTEFFRDSIQRVSIGYGHIWNFTDARRNDYRYEGNRVFIGFEGLRVPALQSLSFDVIYAHEWDVYKNPSAEGPIIFAGVKRRARKDELDVLTFRGNARLFDLPHHRGTVATFVQWDLIQDHSSLFPRHFNEFAVSTGLTYQY